MKNKTFESQQSQQNADIEASGFDAADEAQIAEIVKGLNGEFPEWLLVTQQHDFPFEDAHHDAKDALIGDLGDALTCHYGTLAIFQQGRRLTLAEVRALEAEAIAGLGPISKAIVLGLI